MKLSIKIEINDRLFLFLKDAAIGTNSFRWWDILSNLKGVLDRISFGDLVAFSENRRSGIYVFSDGRTEPLREDGKHIDS